jgi:hypothetical protein
MEKNTNPEINRLNMETSKKAADSLKEWAGVGAQKPPVASSFLNGSTAQMLKESQMPDMSTGKKNNISFSFGLTNTVAALRNSSLNDLPAGKIMLDKYEHLLFGKGISEAFIFEGFFNELKSFSWENSVSPVLENLDSTYEKRRRELEVLKAYETMKNSPGKELFSDATSQMKDWLVSETKSSESLIHGLKRYGFNPMVRNLVSFLSMYENENSGKFHVGFDNNVCEIGNLYSPVHVNESETLFYSSGKFLKMNQETGVIQECNTEEIPTELASQAQIIGDRDVKIDNNKISLNLGNNKIEISFANESKEIYFDGKKINESDLPVAVSVSTNNLLENSNHKISKAIFIAKHSEDIIDLDFGKKIKSKVFEGVEANIFKTEGGIYVQTVNPSMKLNKIYEANATQAINIVKDFIKYDISESLTEFLEGEQAFLSVMKNDKKEIIKNIEILEGELRKIDAAKNENSLIANSQELIELTEGIENEIDSLKDRWNQINLEISRFENKAKELPSVNEDLGYPIDTEVRIKRNGVKGKVIGVDGSSKTYTILFKEGKTGEYFFSDVEDLDDEVDHYDIKAPELDLELTNESKGQNLADAPGTKGGKLKNSAVENLSKKHMSAAPDKKTGSSPKFINNEKGTMSDLPKNTSKKAPLTGRGIKNKSANLADLPKKGKSGSGKKFIDNLENLDLAKAPSASIKGSAKFIDDLKKSNLATLKESQKNSHIEKAPKGKTETPKKFMEDEEDFNFADAHGNSKKNGKRFAEKDQVANLSSAPKSKKK